MVLIQDKYTKIACMNLSSAQLLADRSEWIAICCILLIILILSQLTATSLLLLSATSQQIH